jgi:hypothetical protein
MATAYRPIFHVDADSIKASSPRSPYILIGHPDVYELRDKYHFVPRDDSFGIDKFRYPENEFFQYIYVSKYENVAVAQGFLFPMPVPFSWLGLIRNMLGHKERLYEEIRKTEMEDIPELTAHVCSGAFPSAIGFIVDIPMEVMMGIDIVDGDGNVVSGQAKELRNFIVTLRSKHVSPGWEFNSESVRWYIEDINLTTRRIKWSEPQRQYCPTPKDS